MHGSIERTLEIAQMDRTGDSKNIWNIDVPEEVEAARAVFNSLTGQGYRAFHVNKDGEKGERMDSFVPKAGKMIMVPQLKGG